MDISRIINSEELKDIPIIYIIRVIHLIQKEELQNEEPREFYKELYSHN